MKGWFLYNCAHKNSSIKSSDGQAWIRVLGHFSSKQAALDHAKKIAEHDKGQEIRIAPSAEFRVLLKDRYNDKPNQIDMVTRERETKKHEFLLSSHDQGRKKAFEDTAKNAETRQMGKVEYKVEDRLREIIQLVDPVVTKEAVAPQPEVGRVSEVLRMQNFAALAFIPDYEVQEQGRLHLDEWETECEENYIKTRNLALLEALKGKQIPVGRQLMEDWVTLNPPPKGTNVFGQVAEGPWEKGGDKKQDSEVDCWVYTYKVEQEKRIWAACGLDKPDRAQSIKSFQSVKPLPSAAPAEPAVSFLHVSNTEEELRSWIEKECTLKQYDIACVAMYEWIRVSNVWEDKVKKTFREPLMSKLYEKRDFQSAEAKRLEGQVKEIEIKNEVD